MLHEIIEERRVTSIIDRARKKYPRIDDAWEGLTWLLSRDPGVGESHRGYYRYALGGMFGVPPIVVVYKFDRIYVVIELVYIVE